MTPSRVTAQTELRLTVDTSEDKSPSISNFEISQLQRAAVQSGAKANFDLEPFQRALKLSGIRRYGGQVRR
jgi:hypothetical protein